MPNQKPRIEIPKPPQRQLREQRCGTCHHCQPINPTHGQCHKGVPTAQYIPNPNYIPIRERAQLKGKERQEADMQPIALIMQPYPWPTMSLDFDFCPAWQKKVDIQIARNIRDLRGN